MSDDTFYQQTVACGHKELVIVGQRVGDCRTGCVMVTVSKGFMWSVQSTVRREGTESDGCSLAWELRLHVETSMCWCNIDVHLFGAWICLVDSPTAGCVLVSAACANALLKAKEVYVDTLLQTKWSVCWPIAPDKGSVCWPIAPDKVKCMPTHCFRQRKCMLTHCSRQSEVHADALLQTKWSVCWRIAPDKGSVCWPIAPDKVKCMPTHCFRQRKCMLTHCSRQSEVYADALLWTSDCDRRKILVVCWASFCFAGFTTVPFRASMSLELQTFSFFFFFLMRFRYFCVCC